MAITVLDTVWILTMTEVIIDAIEIMGTGYVCRDGLIRVTDAQKVCTMDCIVGPILGCYETSKHVAVIARTCCVYSIVECSEPVYCDVPKQATLYNTARLMGPKVSIACVWTCVSRPPSRVYHLTS